MCLRNITDAIGGASFACNDGSRRATGVVCQMFFQFIIEVGDDVGDGGCADGHIGPRNLHLQLASIPGDVLRNTSEEIVTPNRRNKMP